MSRPHPAESTEELARRIRVGFASGMEMYDSVHETMFADVIELSVSAWTGGPDEYVPFDHAAAAGTGNYGAFLRRTIPDVGMTGTATALSADTIVVDSTVTGTLADGPLHLHSEFLLTVRDGLVVRYRVRQDPAEMQRFLKATGDPYAGGGVPAVEIDPE